MSCLLYNYIRFRGQQLFCGKVDWLVLTALHALIRLASDLLIFTLAVMDHDTDGEHDEMLQTRVE